MDFAVNCLSFSQWEWAVRTILPRSTQKFRNLFIKPGN